MRLLGVRSVLCLLGTLGIGCGKAAPLDRGGAERLLLEPAEGEALFCRTDVRIKAGLAAGCDGVDSARRVSECLVALEKRGLLEAHCLDQEEDGVLRSPCGGIRVSVDDKARVDDGILSVLCGETRSTAAEVRQAGDVAWITTRTILHVDDALAEAAVSCDLVPGRLPRDGVRVARWHEGRWRLDARPYSTLSTTSANVPGSTGSPRR